MKKLIQKTIMVTGIGLAACAATGNVTAGLWFMGAMGIQLAVERMVNK